MNIYVYLLMIIAYLITVTYSLTEDKDKIIKVLSKSTTENQVIKVINELIYKENSFKNDTFILDYFNDKNWPNGFKLSLEFTSDYLSPNVIKFTNAFLTKEREIINDFNSILNKKKKKDMIRISPIFEWSQNDEEIKIRVKFAKSLETPGEKDINNFKVNCTRSQLEVQGYKIQDDYLVHYYRRLNLYEFIRPNTCSSYKEKDGTYIVHFNKNQYTLYWNFLNQPTEDHYNTYTWFDVFSKYDNKIQYTEFRETAMENLLLSDLEEYMKDDAPLKRKRMRKIAKAANFLISKDPSAKNYCLSPTDKDYCIMPKVDEWGFWQI